MTGNMGGSGMRRGVMVVIGVVAVVVSLVAGCAAGVGIAYVMGNRDGHALVADSAADGAGTSSDTGADADGRMVKLSEEGYTNLEVYLNSLVEDITNNS